MKRHIALKGLSGERIRLALDNLGSGKDRLFRRWVLRHDGWHCVDTGEIAEPTSARHIVLEMFKGKVKSAVQSLKGRRS